MTEPNGDEEFPPDDGDPFETTVDCWDCGGEMYTHHNCGEDELKCLMEGAGVCWKHRVRAFLAKGTPT